jgi:transcriptional regulator with GAF, ATPase, and Fis domain
VAPTDSTVLILGETGTGKELIARAIHDQSTRRNGPLVKVNCAALPRELVESELFGHEKGAFTGATQQRRGRFELADGGSLFLDEIGELSLEAQAKLLRVLQEKEFERVGGTRTLRSDARLIAATNRDLHARVSGGEFRSDLFYRLNVFPLVVPPLRERRPDIPALVTRFLEKSSRKLGKAFEGVAPEFIERAMAYHWPGNVRELENVIERAAILSRGPLLEPLGWSLARDHAESVAGSTAEAASSIKTLLDMEREHIERVLEQSRWVVEGDHGAARALGVKPSTLRGRMRKLGIGKWR